MDTTPTGVPSARMGMRRTARFRISRVACSTSSSGPSTTSSLLQISPIGVATGSRFSASTRTMISRSVTSPLSLPSVSTSTVPMPCSFIALAAADTDSPGAMHIGVGDMMSRIFLTMLHLLY